MDEAGPDTAGARGSAWSEHRIARAAEGVAALALALAALQPIGVCDTFGHLAQGRQIAALGRIPDHDTFSFWRPESAPWHNYEWLSDLWSWTLYARGGTDAVILFHCALVALGGVLLVRLARVHGGARAAMLCAILIVAAIPTARFRLTARPEQFALPLAAFYLTGLASLARLEPAAGRRDVRAWIARLALAHVLWVNLHGSHLLGLALTLIHFVAGARLPHVRSRLGALLGWQALASCVSPFGPAIAIDAIEHLFHPAYRVLVPEWGGWQSDEPAWLVFAPLAQTLLLAAAAVPLWRSGTAARALLLCTLVLALAAFRAVRFVGEYALLSAPALAAAGARALDSVPWRRLRLAFAAAVLTTCVAASAAAARLPPYFGVGHGVRTQDFPVASALWLARHARAPRIFAAVDDSWYLMFAVPRARFFIDGRLPFYGPEHIQLHRVAFADPSLFVRLLDAYRVDTVVLRPTFGPHRKAFEVIRSRRGWVLATLEDRHAVYVRQDLPMRPGATLAASSLHAGYEMAWLLDADAERERTIRADLARLPDHPNVVGYRAWTEAVLALRPFLRAGLRAGVRPPEGAGERAAMERALRWLWLAAEGAPRVPIVHAYHALVATALCALDEASRAVREAEAEGTSRETLFAAQEIALRRGKTHAVEAFLRRAESLPAARGDAWLDAIRQEIRSPPRCP